MDGFLNMLKPPGMTSSDAVLFVRRRLPRGTRVGHGGTLDPEAAGVLPVCVGRATRLFDYIVDKKKRYLAELCLGVETDTQDATGRALSVKDVNVTRAQIEAALRALTGRIEQTPPAYSAIKRDGKRMYELARRGQAVELAPRRVTVEALTYLRPSGQGRHMIQVDCGKGVYVRTLMHDAGRLLGCGGHMSFLLRTRAGIFDIGQAVTPEEIDACADIASCLTPMDAPLEYMARADVGAQHEKTVKNGNPIKPQWLERPHCAPAGGENLRVYVGGRFAGVAQACADGSLRFKAMLLGGQ